jgi:hypothetical protein
MPDMSEFPESMDEMEDRCDAQRDDAKLDSNNDENIMIEHNRLRYTALGVLRKGRDPELVKSLLRDAIVEAKRLDGMTRVVRMLSAAIYKLDDHVGTAICLIDGGHDFEGMVGGCGHCGATHSDIRANVDCIGRLKR